MIHKVRYVPRVDDDVERDLLDGFRGAAFTHIGERLQAVLEEGLGAGAGDGKTELCRMLRDTTGAGKFDLDLLRERIADTGPEQLPGRLGDDVLVDEDAHGAIDAQALLDGTVIVVHDGKARGRRAGGACGGDGEDHLVIGVQRCRLHRIDVSPAADGDRYFGGRKRGVLEQRVDGALRAMRAVVDGSQALDGEGVDDLFDLRCSGSKRGRAADERSLACMVAAKNYGNRLEAIATDGIIAHLYQTHSYLT